MVAKKKSNRLQDSAPLIVAETEKPFGRKLVLVHWMYSFFGVKNFNELTEGFTEKFAEDDIDVNDKILNSLKEKLLQTAPVRLEQLVKYASNIEKYTLEISNKREGFHGWKYFQYLALLFTEIYLEMYFKNASDLLRHINQFLEKFNVNLNTKEKIENYIFGDLNKLAFWNATGSGKTLLMHVNIKQYQYYYKKYHKKKLDHILLLTPNAALSEQHLEELKLSNIGADLFKLEGSNMYAGNRVEILDIYKLEESKGANTIAVESLEGDNLVLVDEGHRGSSGEKWMPMRDRISERGFSFEYSATFGQIISKKEKLYQQYAKCIVFDYSYRHFYNDGYGKDFKILNMQEHLFDEKKFSYLVACLLTYYEQKIFFQKFANDMDFFNIENPLMVFVGSTVIGSSNNQSEKDTDSDVLAFLNFLNEFTTKKKVSIDTIKKILSDKSGILNTKGDDIFAKAFPYLKQLDEIPEFIYEDLLHKVFHCTVAGAKIHLEVLKSTAGEIGIRAGDNPAFGVINIGDARGFVNLCENNGISTLENSSSSESLFQSIKDRDSKINILIGSKKFTEGWNSYRVSCMGLLNIGKEEGTQIIQLFGRGVRLKGFQFSLKRSSHINQANLDRTPPANLHLLETLNIFGIRANYIQKFKDYLEKEGVTDVSEKLTIKLPVHYTSDYDDLKIISLKKGAVFSEKSVHILTIPEERLKTALDNRPIYLNWYTKLQSYYSEDLANPTKQIELERHFFQPYHIQFIDLDRLYFDLIDFKTAKGWNNLIIPKQVLEKLLLDTCWYKLEIPITEFNLSYPDKNITWQEISLNLLEKYVSRFYYHQKNSYEEDKREYIPLKKYEEKYAKSEENSGNLIKEYTIQIENNTDNAEVITYFRELEAQLKLKKFDTIREFTSPEISVIPLLFDQHLYKPLLFSKDKVTLHVSPSNIREQSERKFIQDLQVFYQTEISLLENYKIFLLRNMSRGHGLGFFVEGNFYPDFILWIVEGKKQYISFIDPKGLIEISSTDPKIEFYKKIKKIEQDLGDKNTYLNSFIVTPTKFSQLRADKGYAMSKPDIEAKNVLFMEESSNGLYIHKLFHKILGDKFPKPKESIQQNFLSLISKDISRIFKDLLPVYSIEAACGKFGKSEEVSEEGWVEVNGNLDERMFIAKAIGHSMEPKISDGDYIVFLANPVGSRNNKIILAECFALEDLESNSRFTIKKYESIKNAKNQNEKILLKPLNPEYSTIELLENRAEDEQIRVVAEAIGKYNQETQTIISLK